jgi:malonyl CoA-acyl carrier protein transacylase/NAD(P)-dependent dehydrogenase (short-subunit alcohol dehydrogenase family)
MHAFPPKHLLVRAPNASALAAQVEARLRGEAPRKDVGDACLCIVARTQDEARALLSEAASALGRGEVPDRVGMRATLAPLGGDTLVGMFPGQGSQARCMLASLAGAFVPFAAARRELDRVFANVEGRSIEHWIAEGSDGELMRTDVAQPALGLTSYALARSLAELGVRPARLLGHSYGELVALSVAGAFSAPTLAHVSALRGTLMADAGKHAPGGMVAVRASYQVAEKLVQGHQGLWVANHNAPEQTVVAGTSEALRELEERARHERVATVRLRTGCAFHTPLMAEAARAFASGLRDADICAPTGARVWSNESAAPYASSREAVCAGLSRQIVSEVRFLASIEAIHADGGRIFVEIGPGKVLRDLVSRTLGTRPHLALTFDPGQADAALHLSDVLAQLSIHGVAVDVPHLTLDSPAPPSTTSTAAEAPNGSVHEAFFAANRSAVEAFFAQQRALLERLAAPASDALVQSIMNTNRAVLGDFFSAQQRALDSVGAGSSARATRAPSLASTDGVSAQDSKDSEGARIMEWLRRAIADLTGFALDAVKPSSELENELGLDSITIVEIYTRLTEAFPRFVGLGAEVRKAKTLEDAVSRLVRAVAPPRLEHTASSLPASEEREKGPVVEAESSTAPGKGLAECLLDLIAGATGLDPEHIDLDADFAGTLELDVFTRRELVRRLVEQFPELRVGGLELVFAATPRELLTLCERIAGEHTSDTVQRYVHKRVEYVGEARRALPGRVVVAGVPSRTRALVVSELSHPATQVDVLDIVDRKVSLRGRTLSADDATRLAELAPLLHADVLVVVSPEQELTPPALSDLCAALFSLLKALDQSGAPARLVLVGTDTVAHGAVTGLARALAHEWKATCVRAARIEAALEPEHVERALNALLSGPTELDLYVEATRTARAEIALVPATKHASDPLACGAHVLLTGGGDGITARVAELLAERVGARISAIGRTPMPETMPYPDAHGEAELRAVLRSEVAKTLGRAEGKVVSNELSERFARVMRQRALLATRAKIESLGGSFCYQAADVRDPAALTRAIEALKAAHGPVHGLVHGAGIIEDARLAHKSTQSFLRVLETKLTSALHLEQLLASEPLSFAFLFSSLTAYTGNVGQTDYVAANEALDTLARRWGARAAYPVRALAWSVWHESGLAPGWAKALIAQKRLTGISDAQGRELFFRELSASARGPSSVLLAPPSAIRFVASGGMEQEAEAHA